MIPGEQTLAIESRARREQWPIPAIEFGEENQARQR